MYNDKYQNGNNEEIGEKNFWKVRYACSFVSAKLFKSFFIFVSSVIASALLGSLAKYSDETGLWIAVAEDGVSLVGRTQSVSLGCSCGSFDLRLLQRLRCSDTLSRDVTELVALFQNWFMNKQRSPSVYWITIIQW